MRHCRFSLVLIALLTCCAAFSRPAKSPNGKLTFECQDNHYVLRFEGHDMLTLKAGYDQPICEPLATKPQRIACDYEMLSGKKRRCTNRANEYTVKGTGGWQMVVRLYDDGLAFRYELTGGAQADKHTELTAYHIGEGTRRWMQQWCDSYEEFFPLSTTGKMKPVHRYGRQFMSPEGWNTRWGYPALLEPSDGLFALITEANIERGHSASSLWNEADTETFCVVPDESDAPQSGWRSPWRVVICGRLADVVQSTLVTDVSDPCRLADTSWIKPGVVSWIYWAYNHGSNDLDIIRKYTDMAVSLHLPYMLIDAEWDQMKDGHSVEEALADARRKGVKPLIWYNSSVGWVDGAPTPKYRLNKAEDREREFAWCERMGVAGVKIDFFSGDTQMNMDYCIDLLESAARHHLLVNFHGATVPRGWQRTWPNLLSTEGVYGAEWYNNVPTFTKRAAAHNATLPFTRNVIGPMDYTPCTFSDSQHPHITTAAHELALTILFESGLQHLADKPESYMAQPLAVRDFLSTLPNVWDETLLLDGYPGDHVVMARRCGNTWFVAGINGTDEVKTLAFRLPKGVKGSGCTLFADHPQASEKKAATDQWAISNPGKAPTEVVCQPRGGFVIKF